MLPGINLSAKPPTCFYATATIHRYAFAQVT